MRRITPGGKTRLNETARRRDAGPRLSALSVTILAALTASPQAFAACSYSPQSCVGTDVFEANTAGAISGASFITFADDSVLDATASDAISGGIASFIDRGQLNASAANAISGGTQYFDYDSVLNASVANAISGGGQMIGGNSVLNVSAAGAISGGTQTIDYNGTLNALVTGAISGDQELRRSGTLKIGADNALSTSSSVAFTTAVSGPGGILDLNGHSTTIGRINSASGAGLITNNGNDAGILTVGAAGTATFSGVIQDGGHATTGLAVSTGTLILSGTNTYTGGTTVHSGVLRAGSATGLVGDTAYVVNGGTLDLNDFSLDMRSLSGTGGTIALGTAPGTELTIDQDDDTEYAGDITGGGGLTKSGAGTLILSGTGTYAGDTTVAGGTLAVNGALGGPVQVLAAGRLQGAGTVGDTTVLGVIAPGNSIGTLRVAGNIGFAAGSVYEVEADAAGQADRIEATGTATIDPAAIVRVLAGAGDYAPATDYTILSAAGGISGAFGGVTSNLAFLTPSMAQDTNDIILRLTRNDVSYGSVGRTPNQIATGAAVESLPADQAVRDGVLNLSADQARDAFDQLSGELHASAQAALIMNSHFVRDAANDRLRAAFAAPGAAPAPMLAYGYGADSPTLSDAAPGLLPVSDTGAHGGPTFWSQAYGAWGSVDGDGNAARLSQSAGGLLVGADGRIGRWRLGLMSGFGHSSFDSGDRRSSGSSQDYHLGVYGGSAWGALALRAGAIYTWHDAETRRSVSIPGLDQHLSSDSDAATLQAFGELGYEIRLGRTRVEPFLNVTHARLRADGYIEHGGSAALSAPDSTLDTTFTTLGARAETRVQLGTTQATLSGTLGWRHASGDVTPTMRQRFVAGGTPFTVAGAPIARNSALLEAGLDVRIARATTLGIAYTGRFASDTRDHGLTATLAARF